MASQESSAVVTSTTSKAVSTSPVLALLPKDLFQSILTKYCDGYTLKQFWLATCVATNQTSFWSDEEEGDTAVDQDVKLVEDVQEMISSAFWTRSSRQFEIRKNKKHFADVQLSIETSFDQRVPFDALLSPHIWTKYFSKHLFALDYCEQVPINLVWCGKLRFRDPRALRPFDATSALVEEAVQVMLLSGRGAIMMHARQWDLGISNNNDDAVTSTTNNDRAPDRAFTSIVLQNYNFVPVGSGGRLVGVTPADRLALKKISQRMARDDLVGTLETSYRSGGRNENGLDFAVRVISFAQVHQRLERVPSILRRDFDDRTTTMKAHPPFATLERNWDVLKEENNAGDGDLNQNSDECSLHCSWDFDERYDGANFQMHPQQERAALLQCYRNYRNLFQSSSDDDASKLGW